MASVDQDFELYQGTKLTVTIPITDDDGNPVDPSTATAIVWQAWAPGGESATISKALGSGIEANSTAITLTLAAADTSDLTPREYQHEGRLTINAAPDVSFTGEMKLFKSLTN